MGAIVNGRVRDFSSIELTIKGQIFNDFNEIEYEDGVSRSRVMGKHPRGVGFTRGTYEPTGKVTFSTDEEFRRFQTALGNGLYDQTFNISCTYSIPGGELAKDELITCKLKKQTGGGSSGGEPSRDVELDVGHIVWDGKEPFID